jgi:uncharacterized protein
VHLPAAVWVFGAVHLSTGRSVLLALAGFGAGLFNGVAGGGTLLSFPVLLALGYPALTANVTSTVGIWPGYLGGVAGFRREIGAQTDRFAVLAPVTVLGALVGAILLLTTPSSTFTRIAPWLVLFASVLFALAPLLSRRLAGEQPAQPHRAALWAGMFLAAVYGGYFGAAMGVIMLAVLGLTLPDTLVRSSGIRAVLSVVANGVAAIVFIVHGHLQWAAAGLLAAGSVLGGYVGASVARRLPAAGLRVIVVAIGLATGIKLLVG